MADEQGRGRGRGRGGDFRRSKDGEEDREEDESVQAPEEDDGKEHAEVVDAEEVGCGEGEDGDADKLCEEDARDDAASHVGDGHLRALVARAAVEDESARDVHAKLDGNADAEDEVECRNVVQADVGQGHDAKEARLDAGNDKDDDEGRAACGEGVAAPGSAIQGRECAAARSDQAEG